MPSSRKRARSKADETIPDRPRKKTANAAHRAEGKSPEIKHAVISQYFGHVLSLRDYVLMKLPGTSRLRRKKIASVGISSSEDANVPDIERGLGLLLDTALVGCKGLPDRPERVAHATDNRRQQWTNFTQKGDESHVTLSDGLAGAVFSQSEVCILVTFTRVAHRC